MTEMTERKIDVLVAGGGMAGIAAAVAAARSGAKTMLVERAGWLGGVGITGATGLHSFFNVFDAAPGAQPVKLVGGIAQELVERTTALGGGVGHVRMEKGGDFVSYVTPVEPECFKLAAHEMIVEAGVELLLHTVVDGVEASGGHLDGVMIWNKAGRQMIRPKVVVDCTGDGDLAAGAGASFAGFGPGIPGAYPFGFTFRLCNVDLQKAERELAKLGWLSQLAHAVKPGMKEPDLVRLGIDMRKVKEAGFSDAPGYFLSSSLRPRELTYCNCVNFAPANGIDPVALTQAEGYLRRRMLEIADLFRKAIPGFEDAYAAGPSPSAGVRRGRAIRCVYELSSDDCTEGRRFDDEVALFGFIDNSKHFVKDAGAYGIPYRALRPKGLDNVLIAGRMMTVDYTAHNSTRNTACCLAAGQAAGIASAIASRTTGTTGAVDPGELRTALRTSGAILEPVPWRG